MPGKGDRIPPYLLDVHDSTVTESADRQVHCACDQLKTAYGASSAVPIRLSASFLNHATTCGIVSDSIGVSNS